jgi:hypothetical protein
MKLVYGHGITDVGEFLPFENGKQTKAYVVWKNVLQRCFDKKLHERFQTYKDCSICNEWLLFQNFAKWFSDNYIDGYYLDKDLLFVGNKMYSPERCCFVPNRINCLLATNKAKNLSGIAIGVKLQDSRYRAIMSDGKRKIHIGYFDSESDAKKAYNKAKIQLAESIIESDQSIPTMIKSKIINNLPNHDMFN